MGPRNLVLYRGPDHHDSGALLSGHVAAIVLYLCISPLRVLGLPSWANVPAKHTCFLLTDALIAMRG